MNITSFGWLLPFIFFLGGYFLVAFLVGTPTLETPQCIGKNIQEALALLADYDLNVKLLEQKEDDDIEAGTVIAQNPNFKQKVKPHQTVFLVVSKKKEKIVALKLVGKTVTTITQELKAQNIVHKNYEVPSPYPPDICIAQIPSAGQPLEEHKIITYSAAPAAQEYIFPDVTKNSIKKTISFLQEYGITPQLAHVSKQDKNHVCKNCIIVEQKPLAGSIVKLDNSLDVQLRVSHV